MKKTKFAITIALTIFLVTGAIGVIFAANETSFNANAGGRIIYNPTGTFTGPSSGIRWNGAAQAFEVFNYTGVSIMGQGKQYVNASGEVRTTAAAGYQLASAQSNYNIMNDITYSPAQTVYNNFDEYGGDFGTSTEKAGIIEGNDFTFKYFPVGCPDPEMHYDLRYGHDKEVGLYGAFNGTLRNLNLDFGYVNSESFYSIGSNYGTIENCTVLGGGYFDDPQGYGWYYCNFSPFVYTNQSTGVIKNCENRFVVYGSYDSVVAGFAISNLGLIDSCTNQADLSGSQVSGIAGISNISSQILNCKNTANLTAFSYNTSSYYNIASGIAHANSAGNYTIRGCINTGTITASDSSYGVACGILSAPNNSPLTFFSAMTNSYNNTNNGTLTCGRAYAFPLYYGRTGSSSD